MYYTYSYKGKEKNVKIKQNSQKNPLHEGAHNSLYFSFFSLCIDKKNLTLNFIINFFLLFFLPSSFCVYITNFYAERTNFSRYLKLFFFLLFVRLLRCCCTYIELRALKKLMFEDYFCSVRCRIPILFSILLYCI